MTLKDKVAVVTGGSNGIGAATVRMLAADGANVVICYNKGKERAEALLLELPKANHRIQQLTVEDAASIGASGRSRPLRLWSRRHSDQFCWLHAPGSPCAARRARRRASRFHPDHERARAV